MSRAFNLVPISSRAWERLATWAILLIIAGGIVGVAFVAGVPAMIRGGISESVANLGFAVKRVQVTGVKHMDRLAVYNIALDQQRAAMTDVDLAAVRHRLLGFGWIADARVSRRLPDTLVVDIIEREPAAIWQHAGQLTLIDATGVPLARVSPDNAPNLPLLIGPDANGQAKALDALLARATRLKPLIAAATWIGDRRWDIQFQTGETLSLPEGEGAAATALTKFEGLDASDRLLGRGLVRFDMRDPTRMFVRVKRQAAPTISQPKPVPEAVAPVAAPAVAVPAADKPGVTT
ncbi:cell division protein FtsQ/DivIB [Sphingomonas antarctica]|uniref:cell division protein FtsQ/DivIB n=1 Tax=Sphingomonas antarctica TaxID=2040274 RepID=UPI0039E9FBBF